MRDDSLPPLWGTWLVLAGATVASWLVFEEAGTPGLAATLVILIAAVKIRLVFTRFMELHRGVMPWRLVFEVWLALVTAIVLGGYWYAGGGG